MAVPQRKTSKTRSDKRRAHDALQFTTALIKCENCGEWKQRHRVCLECGTYRGRRVFDVQEA